MLGAATTFLGIMPLAFANNVIFRVFFKMFLVIITFGVRKKNNNFVALWTLVLAEGIVMAYLME